MMHKSKFFLAMPLFSVILVDSIGLSVIIPMLYSLIMNPDVSILNQTVDSSTRYFYYNIAMCAFMIGWFFGSVILGDLSDKIGRKYSLLLSLLGFMCGFILSGVAVITQSFWILIIGRLLCGFTAGNQTIVMAGTIDICGIQDRARFLGYIQFASSLGTISGPIIGGFLSDSTYVSWFNFATPFYFSAILALLNVFLIYFFYNETNPRNFEVKADKGYVQLIIPIFKNTKLRQLSIIALLIMLGWSAYYTTISLFMQDRLHYSAADVAEYLAVSVLGFLLGSLCLINMLKRTMDNRRIVVVGLLLAVSGLIITLLSTNFYLLSAMAIIICCGFSLAVTAFLAEFSNNVTASEQGWVMGVSQTITAFAFGVAGLVQAMVSHYSLMISIFGAIILLVCAAGAVAKNAPSASNTILT